MSGKRQKKAPCSVRLAELVGAVDFRRGRALSWRDKDIFQHSVEVHGGDDNYNLCVRGPCGQVSLWCDGVRGSLMPVLLRLELFCLT